MNFPNFMAHTERAFDNVLLVYCAYQRRRHVLAQLLLFDAKRDNARCLKLRIPIKLNMTNHLNKWKTNERTHKKILIEFGFYRLRPRQKRT